MSSKSDDAELLCVIPKNERTQVRFYRSSYRGRTIIDARIWWVPKEQEEFLPSTKGFAFDSSHLQLLSDAFGGSK